MELNKLYSIANKENITVVPFKMKNKAIIGLIDNQYCIGLNYRDLTDSREEKEILAEELRAAFLGGLYGKKRKW